MQVNRRSFLEGAAGALAILVGSKGASAAETGAGGPADELTPGEAAKQKMVNSNYDPGLHIFVDDREVRNVSNVYKRWGQLKKHPGPVLQPDLPHEANRVQVNTVIFDEKMGRFRCWYLSQDFSAPVNRKGVICYAESRDGVSWEKPELGLYEWNGSRKNNICLTGEAMYPLDVNLPTVFLDANEPDPEKRYKNIMYMQDERMYQQPELWAVNHYLFTSPDGIHWTKQGINTNAGSVSDRFYPAYDQKRGLWMAAMGAASGEGSIRMIGLKESQDLQHWSDLIVPFKPDDSEGHGNRFDHHTLYPFLYGNQYLGYFDRYEQSSFIMFNELVSSRDARNWERPNREVGFNRAGPPGDFDTWWILFASNPPIRLGDELYFYYQGSGPPPTRICLGLGRLRREGFCGLMNMSKRGAGAWVLTEPVEVLGENLFVNASVYENGELRVGIQDAHYSGIGGYQAAKCIPVTGDGTRLAVRWEGDSNLKKLVGRKVVMRFEFSRATLYAYRFGA